MDVSPAACHIAYNYNTPVDTGALKREFERIETEVKRELLSLYQTEHYEPAIGDYDVRNPTVSNRLKNAPGREIKYQLLEEDDEESRTWELLSKAEVEDRLGYSVAQLPRRTSWGALDLELEESWICIP